MAARVRGGNPFRHRIGYWWLNHYLVASHSAASTWQLVRYYDDVLAALAANRPFEDIVAVASVSAAITQQYGTQYNRFWDGYCYCNEDFAREFHQLGFGILGVGDTDYHEFTSIKNTAKALTGMRFTSNEAPNPEWEGERVVFETDGHVPGAVEIQRKSIAGATAREKIAALADISVKHPEARANLPIIIIQGLADDEISSTEAQALRTAWNAMPKKNLLRFLRAYAISKQFHARARTKRLNSIERFMIIANRFADSNIEHYRDHFAIWRLYWDEEVLPFAPWYEVFGHQTGVEAANSAQIFTKHYSATTQDIWRYLVQEDRPKDWRRLLPNDGRLTVREAAEWLWRRFVADGLRNFGPLERAHMYALIAQGTDAAAVFTPTVPNGGLSLSDIQSAAGQQRLTSLGNMRLQLNHTNAERRAVANQYVGTAFAFMIATPYMLIQEGG
jgi:hypothetical protein